MIRVRFYAAILCALAGASDAVERGSDGSPCAFRVWSSGANPTDHGVHTFSKRSAELLMQEQTIRGNLYSIDADHMSLDNKASPEARKAVGWHRLEVRQSKSGPELWAVDVEWTDAVKAGLTKDPPEWRYFSPAYDVDKKSGEIVSYLNTALTNNPATWSVTALASSTSNQGIRAMKLAALLAAMMGDDQEKKAEARAALTKCAEGDDADAKKAAAILSTFGDEDAGDGGEKKEKKAAEEAPAPPPEKKEEKKAAEGEPDEAAAKVAASIVKLGEQERRIAELEKVQEATDRAKILATRSDLTKAQLEVLAGEPLAKLPKLLALIPVPAVDPAAAAKVAATRGAGRNGDGGGEGFGAMRASRLPEKERAEVRARMGGEAPSKGIHWDPERANDLVFATMTKAEARAALAVKAKRSAEMNGGGK